MIEEIREKIEEKRCGRAAIDFNKPSLVREGFASVRSTLAGVAETGAGPRERWVSSQVGVLARHSGKRLVNTSSVSLRLPPSPTGEGLMSLPLHKGA